MCQCFMKFSKTNLLGFGYLFRFFSFGVCCVFVYEGTGGTISQNCSYIRNPGYPNAMTDTAGIQFNVVKCDPSKPT